MKFIKGLVFGLCAMSSVAFAQQAAAQSKVLFACEIPAGELLKTEAVSNIVIQDGSGAQAQVVEVIGNEAFFDDKAEAAKKFGLGFDQVDLQVIDDENQILTDYVLGTDYADVLASAGVTDPTAIGAVYVFQAANSKLADYQLLTFAFIGQADASGKAAPLGSAVVLLINQNGQQGSVLASCKI